MTTTQKHNNRDQTSDEAPKEMRLSARLPAHMHEFVKNAADVSGATLTQFIIEAVLAKAQTIMEREHIIRLTKEGASTVLEAFENPAPINNNLRELALHHAEFSNAQRRNPDPGQTPS